MSKIKKSIIIWPVLGILSLVVFILLFDHVSPVASINIKLDKHVALEKAAAFIDEQGFVLEGYDKVVVFDCDRGASTYLQKTQGIKITNELVENGIPIWFWKVRWFKELDKKGFTVRVDPATAEIVKFSYSVLEDEEGADLTESQAQALAEQKIALSNVDLSNYALKSSTTKQRKHRTDHCFVWEKLNYKIEDATLRLNVNIYGNKLGGYSRYLKVPEVFSRSLNKENSYGGLLATISATLMFLVAIAAIFILVTRYKQFSVKWNIKFGFIFACIILPVQICRFLNQLPLFWNFYPSTISKVMFVARSLQGVLMNTLSLALMVFAFGAVGDFFSRGIWREKAPLLNSIRNKSFSARESAPILIVGYSLGFIFLGYITLFYLIGTKFFDIWVPSGAGYTNMLGTALPFLPPLLIAMTAAVSEELIHRLFSISIIKKLTSSTAIAVFIAALIWGFAHSNYPIHPHYVRGIELTIFAVVLGIVFLNYGLETVIIAHFVINAILLSMPLFKSGNPYFIFSGTIVAVVTLLPLVILCFQFRSQTPKA